MDAQLKSSLIGKTGTLICCGFGKHPIDRNKWVNVMIYKIDTGYVSCLSEGVGYKKINEQVASLGNDFPGELFAPFAARFVDIKLPYEQFKKTVYLEGLDAKLHWID